MTENPVNLSYEDILENVAEGVVVVGVDLRVRVFNQASEKMMEVSRTSVLGRPVSEVFPRDERLVEMLTKTLTEGRLYAEYEEKLHRRFSGALPVGITTSQVFDSGGELTGAVALVRDLSGVKGLEESSLRKERLAYIGTFAASLAHELKNPLSGLRGTAQLLSRKVDDEALVKYTGVIMREADRLNTILNDMLSFTRPAVLKKKPLNIHRVLDSVIMLMEESGGPPELVKEYDPSIPEVSGDEGQLTQVFLNLAKNACEAVGAEGRVTVVTRMTTDFHLVPGGSEVTGGRRRMMASVEVRDNGPGIEPDDLEKIFTPFFTTKGGGSGLGMPISLKIVKEHGGLLRIYSTPGEGTSVMVYLPLAEDGGGEG